MGVFNSIVVTERHQRPSMNGVTILKANFLRDGQYLDLTTAQVSSVMLFDARANTSPSSVLEASTGLVPDSQASAALWRWDLSGGNAGVAGTAFATEDGFARSDNISASSIFRTGEGRFAVVLNGADDVSSYVRDGREITSTSALSAVPAGKYIDVWTVKLDAAADWITLINETQFYQNNAVIITTPLLFNTRNQLTNKKVKIGSIEKLKVTTEVTVENKDIDDSVKNTIKEGLVTSASLEILKHNVDNNLPAWVTVSGYTDTEASVDVTADNTFLFTFDTNVLNDGSISNLGNGTGTYSVKAKYKVLDETIITPEMYFTVY